MPPLSYRSPWPPLHCAVLLPFFTPSALPRVWREPQQLPPFEAGGAGRKAEQRGTVKRALDDDGLHGATTTAGWPWTPTVASAYYRQEGLLVQKTWRCVCFSGTRRSLRKDTALFIQPHSKEWEAWPGVHRCLWKLLVGACGGPFSHLGLFQLSKVRARLKDASEDSANTTISTVPLVPYETSRTAPYVTGTRMCDGADWAWSCECTGCWSGHVLHTQVSMKPHPTPPHWNEEKRQPSPLIAPCHFSVPAGHAVALNRYQQSSRFSTNHTTQG